MAFDAKSQVLVDCKQQPSDDKYGKCDRGKNKNALEEVAYEFFHNNPLFVFV